MAGETATAKTNPNYTKYDLQKDKKLSDDKTNALYTCSTIIEPKSKKTPLDDLRLEAKDKKLVVSYINPKSSWATTTPLKVGWTVFCINGIYDLVSVQQAHDILSNAESKITLIVGNVVGNKLVMIPSTTKETTKSLTAAPVPAGIEMSNTNPDYTKYDLQKEKSLSNEQINALYTCVIDKTKPPFFSGLTLNMAKNTRRLQVSNIRPKSPWLDTEIETGHTIFAINGITSISTLKQAEYIIDNATSKVSIVCGKVVGRRLVTKDGKKSMTIGKNTSLSPSDGASVATSETYKDSIGESTSSGRYVPISSKQASDALTSQSLKSIRNILDQAAVVEAEYGKGDDLRMSVPPVEQRKANVQLKAKVDMLRKDLDVAKGELDKEKKHYESNISKSMLTSKKRKNIEKSKVNEATEKIAIAEEAINRLDSLHTKSMEDAMKLSELQTSSSSNTQQQQARSMGGFAEKTKNTQGASSSSMLPSILAFTVFASVAIIGIGYQMDIINIETTEIMGMSIPLPTLSTI